MEISKTIIVLEFIICVLCVYTYTLINTITYKNKQNEMHGLQKFGEVFDSELIFRG